MKISCRKLLSLPLLNDLMKYRNYVTLTQTSVYPREVVLRALHHQAAAVVLAHNHPSGSVQPSRADEMLTQTLKTTLALIDVRVLDHIIVAPGEALSMAERGLM
jgi:DNA repair protein RadC